MAQPAFTSASEPLYVVDAIALQAGALFPGRVGGIARPIPSSRVLDVAQTFDVVTIHCSGALPSRLIVFTPILWQGHIHDGVKTISQALKASPQPAPALVPDPAPS